MSDTVWFPPLDKGALVVTDVVSPPLIDSAEAYRMLGALSDAYGTADRCDVVLVAVPAGEGCAVEAAIRRALRVEGTA